MGKSGYCTGDVGVCLLLRTKPLIFHPASNNPQCFVLGYATLQHNLVAQCVTLPHEPSKRRDRQHFQRAYVHSSTKLHYGAYTIMQ